CALVSWTASTSMPCAPNQSKNPLLAAERRPFALKLVMRMQRPVPGCGDHSNAWENGGMAESGVPGHRRRFLELALRVEALRFGEFTLKSGRASPYFFNAGRFDSGAALATLAGCYADAIDATGIGFDLLFGPAYKGIPLATALACEYARRGRDLPVAFNRKEAKDHGEAGR